MIRLIALVVTAWVLPGCVGTRGVSRVDANLYRAPQPTHSQLEKYVPAYGIQSVISLRDNTPEYEIGFCEMSGVDYYNVPLNKLNGFEELEHVFKTARKPILLHCFWGKDRTGAAVDYWVKNRERW